MGIPGPGPPPKQHKPSPQIQLTAHLYECREVELCFQTAALMGDTEAAVYWLLELCESGWVDDAWNQLWLAYYDFYAAHNPQFEGELMELSRMRTPKGKRSRYPLLHGASALIGRQRSAGAWTLRQGTLARNPGKGSKVGFPDITDDIIGALMDSPQVAVEVLAPFVHATWMQLTPLYRAIVTWASGDVGGACGAWGNAGSSPISVLCSLLLLLQLEHQDWVCNGKPMLDDSPIEADRELVRDAIGLVRRTRVTPARDRLLMWRQFPIPKAIGSLDKLPRHKLPHGGLKRVLQEEDWLAATAGCRPWDRAIERCGGHRRTDSRQVIWDSEEAKKRFWAHYDPDIDELPPNTIAAGTTEVPAGSKLRWLKNVWAVKPQPDLWKALLMPRN